MNEIDINNQNDDYIVSFYNSGNEEKFIDEEEYEEN